MLFFAEFEQKALEQGIEQGLRRGVANSLREVLQIRFGEVPELLLDGIEETKSVEELETLLKRALTATSIDPILADFEKKSFEKGIEQGIEQGIRKGVINSLRDVFEVRFGEVPESLFDSIEQYKSVDEVKTLHKRALTATSIEQVFMGQ